MTYKPVDAAIVMTVGPLIDDSDFKSLEEAIAYNAAGMDISLIVEKTDGTTAVTAITLTTAGTSDWTHKDGGYYEVEITAAQNAEEGIAYLRGVCTGVLPFESPRYDIVVANIYDSWVKGTDKLQTDLAQIGGVVQSLTDFKDMVDTGYDPANHKIQSDLIYIHGTALTETDGQLAAAFKKLFDVATPLLVASDVMVGTDSAALATTALSNVTWTDARAGYLDNLSAGAVALDAGVDITKIHGVALTETVNGYLAAGFTKLFDVATPLLVASEVMRGTDGANTTVPDAAGIAAGLHTTTDGKVDAVAGDVAPLVSCGLNEYTQTTLFLDAGSNIDNTYVGTTVIIFDVSNNDYPCVRTCTAFSGTSRMVTFAPACDFTINGADQVKIYPYMGYGYPPTAAEIRTEMEDVGTKLTGVKDKTDNIPASPAPSGEYDTQMGYIPSNLGDVPIASELNTDHGSGSWATATGFSTHNVAAIWDDLISGMIAVGSIGKLIADNLDAAITSRNATTPPTVGEIRTEMEGVGTKLTLTLEDTADLQANQADWATATSVTVSDKTGFSLSTAGVDAILDEYIEGTHSLREMMRLFASMLVGKVSGGGTTTITFRDIDDTKNRIVMTVTDVGNRTALNLTED